ncbi:Cytochrome P450 CYP2 subfamily [Handroanthus impetiginosus]|uniref:Cytochrome P450 CYP2 subfamily n=1 Tax=Handroanthus impetiginosus TaxID=429701 RepID=A0A2G9HU80_9LAMI|nr:Cytochrome P450 CYP2 subfamily [Handroanthus impetiginosus]
MELLLSFLILIFSIFFILRHLNSSKHKNLPPSPPSLPILGHLHLLKNSSHRALQSLSNKYGPITYLQFGCRPVLLVSSPSAAEQCFSKNDVVFANRPNSIATKILGYNFTTVVTAPYGDHWRNLRRLTTIQIFSSASLQHSSAIRAEETRLMEVNLNNLFFQLVYDVVMMVVCGKRGCVLNDFFGTTKAMDVCDYVPFLRLVGFQGMEKKMMNMQRKRDGLLQDLIDEAREKINGGSSLVGERKTYIEALLEIQRAEPEYYTDWILKGLIQPMFTAGTHTTTLTMEWAMSLLLNHPHELNKAKNEINDNMPPGKLLMDSDLHKLPYLRCIINETLRLYPVAPLLVPHTSSEDCKIEGFNIPKDTILLVNAWAIQRDPKLWDEPEMFKPERFMGVQGDFDGFRFIPFGVGRRACPGSGMALRLAGLALGTLIQCFEWEREGSELIDLEEVAGFTLSKAKPLEALYRPRPCMMSILSQL